MRWNLNIAILIIIAFILLFIAYGLWCNQALDVNRYDVESERVPEAFDGFKIAHISDVHNTEIGRDNEKLLKMLEAAEPDIIAITGDLIDSRQTKIDVALKFVEEALKIAPCYYVSGNHEQRIEEYIRLNTEMKKLGVEVLENRKIQLEKNGETIIIAGIDDPMFTMDPTIEEPDMVIEEALGKLISGEDGYTILLSHRPEVFEVYAQSSTDLVLCGHAHGGQIKVPFVGGIISPGEGFFPKYYEGIHREKGTVMVISRGIGNSLFPIRINNRPEVGLVVLGTK